MATTNSAKGVDEKDKKISEVPHLQEVTGVEKIPVSAVGGLPRYVEVNQIVEKAQEDNPWEKGSGVNSIQQKEYVDRNKASGYNSVALGFSATASGYGSFAHGTNVTATADDAFAINAGSTASGSPSFAFGSGTAEGFYSAAGGDDTFALNYAEFAIGKSNYSKGSASDVIGSSEYTLFTVGNGTLDYGGIRHNAFEVRQSGDIYIPNVNAEGEYYEKPMINLQEKLKAHDDRFSTIINNVYDITDPISNWMEEAKSINPINKLSIVPNYNKIEFTCERVNVSTGNKTNDYNLPVLYGADTQDAGLMSAYDKRRLNYVYQKSFIGGGDINYDADKIRLTAYQDEWFGTTGTTEPLLSSKDVSINSATSIKAGVMSAELYNELKNATKEIASLKAQISELKSNLSNVKYTEV